MAKVSKERLKETVKFKLSTILQREASDPRLEFVTIVDIKISPDQAQATVFFAVYGKTEEEIQLIGKALQESTGFLQQKLARTLTSRRTPKLHFVYDSGFEHESKIDDLLGNLRKKGELE